MPHQNLILCKHLMIQYFILIVQNIILYHVFHQILINIDEINGIDNIMINGKIEDIFI